MDWDLFGSDVLIHRVLQKIMAKKSFPLRFLPCFLACRKTLKMFLSRLALLPTNIPELQYLKCQWGLLIPEWETPVNVIWPNLVSRKCTWQIMPCKCLHFSITIKWSELGWSCPAGFLYRVHKISTLIFKGNIFFVLNQCPRAFDTFSLFEQKSAVSAHSVVAWSWTWKDRLPGGRW